MVNELIPPYRLDLYDAIGKQAARELIADIEGLQEAVSSSNTFNVKDYGAIGDGVVDDSAAVQSTIAACIAAGGGTVFAPKGTYLVSNITLDSNVTLAGVGRGATVFKQNPSANISPKNTSGSGYTYDIPTLRINATSSTYVENVGMRDFTVDGNKTALAALDTTYRHYGIYIGGAIGMGSYPQDISVHRVEVKNAKSYGFDIIRVNRVVLVDCISHNNGIDNTTNNKSSGFEILADDVRLIGCNSYNNRVGFALGSNGTTYNRISLIGCTAQGNANEGISASQLSDSSFIGGASRDNLLHGIALYNSCIECTIHGMSISGNIGNGIRFDSATYCSAIGNLLNANSLGGAGYAELRFVAPSANCLVSGNVIAANASPNPAVDESVATGPNIVVGNMIKTGATTPRGTGSQWRNNIPLQPQGHGVAQPSMPASTVTATIAAGTAQQDCMVYVTAGAAATAIAVAGVTALIVPANGVGSVYVPAGSTVTPTYASGTPTWSWFGV